MKNIKNLFTAVYIIFGLGLLYLLSIETISPELALLFAAIVPGGIFIFNLLVRRNKGFKNYFMSDWNFFTDKFNIQKEYDIPSDLMLEKLAEVIGDSKFNIRNIDRENNEIFATTSMTAKSWGENLYISLIQNNGKTMMDFNSVAFFQMVSWGKNRQNYDQLIGDIDQSLII